MMTHGRSAFLPVGSRLPRFSALDGQSAFDVIVVGAGITGLTTARLLGHAGLRVAVLEAARVGGGATGFSTGQLTALIDAGYVSIESDFGADGAKAVAGATMRAIDMVEAIVQSESIACAIRRVPTYMYAESAKDLETITKEAEAAVRAGLSVQLAATSEVPFRIDGVVRLDGQLDIDPSAYVQGLAKALPPSVTLFEETRVVSIEDGKEIQVKTDRGDLHAAWVVEATHVPGGRNSFHAKTAPYRSYVIAARSDNTLLPPGIFVDSRDPYLYLRDYGGLVLAGGEDHKTGQKPEGSAPFETLEVRLRERLAVGDVEHRWTTELYASVDGLPYIGPMSRDSHHLIATGFDGDGLVFGTLSGEILSEYIQGRVSAEAELFKPSRTKLIASAQRFVKEQVNVAFHLVGDRIKSAPSSTEGISAGTGAVVDLEGTRCAVFRDEQGELHVRSATGPHAGCVVQWNQDSRTFDCPCHGGCFSPKGDVLGGPPATGLAPVDVNVQPDTQPEPSSSRLRTVEPAPEVLAAKLRASALRVSRR